MAKVNLTDLKKQAEKLTQEVSLAQARVDKIAKKNTKETLNILKEIIKEYKQIDGIRWTQYTPHFNDGNECTFDVHELEVKFSEDFLVKNEELEDEDEWLDEYFINKRLESMVDTMNVEEVQKVKAAINTMEEIHGRLQVNSSGLKAAFGDHTTVTLTIKGIETEEYEHD